MYNYHRFIQSLLVGLISLGTFCSENFNMKLPSFVYPLIVGLVLWLYTKFIWVIFELKKFYHGKWWGYTKYLVLERKAQPDVPSLPINNPHYVKFSQSPFELDIEPSLGRDFVSWKSEAVKLSGNTIHMVYSVIRSNPHIGFPKSYKGYEVIDVVDRNFLGVPIELKGVFYHIAESGNNLFSGETHYRKGKPSKAFIKQMESDTNGN